MGPLWREKTNSAIPEGSDRYKNVKRASRRRTNHRFPALAMSDPLVLACCMSRVSRMWFDRQFLHVHSANGCRVFLVSTVFRFLFPFMVPNIRYVCCTKEWTCGLNPLCG